MYMLKSISVFAIVVALMIVSSMFYALVDKILKSQELITASFVFQYKPIISILILLIILLLLLLLAITCTYTKFLQILGTDERIDLHRNQIFFNLIQLNIDNMIESGETDNNLGLIYDSSPPDYNTVIASSNNADLSDQINKCESHDSLKLDTEPPPSYDMAILQSIEQPAASSFSDHSINIHNAGNINENRQTKTGPDCYINLDIE